jgi:hypothetical protein
MFILPLYFDAIIPTFPNIYSLGGRTYYLAMLCSKDGNVETLNY